MVKKFSINLVKFQDKYLNAIKTGIKLRYKELYPNNKITIGYKKNMWDEIYKFYISASFKIFSNEDGSTINKLVQLEAYTNIEAINIFSNISMEEYLEEYDDSRKNYMQQLQEYIDGMIIAYKMLGLDFKTVELKPGSYWISLKTKSERIIMGPSDYISGYMQYDIITESDFKNAKPRIKNGLEKFLKKYKK
jgi:hypothetical protein